MFQIATKPMVIHFSAAVSTIYQTGQRIGLTHAVMPSRCFPKLLGKLPSFTVNDCFVGIFEDQPILFGISYTAFVLVGFFVITEIHRITHIFWFCKDLSYNMTIPIIRVRKLLSIFPETNSTLTQIDARGFHLIFV